VTVFHESQNPDPIEAMMMVMVMVMVMETYKSELILGLIVLPVPVL